MGRSFAHWTPKYIKDKLLVIYDEKKNPHNPWLTKDATRFLDQVLRPNDTGIEFGSGRSTLWFAARINRLISVEHDLDWHSNVTRLIEENGLTHKVDYRFRQNEDQYVAEIENLVDNSIDFCLIDGIGRDRCALRMLPKLKCGALIVVDNINWFLLSDSMAPSSRRLSDGCASKEWQDFSNSVRDWRRYWTSNGVSDTCIWIKA